MLSDLLNFDTLTLMFLYIYLYSDVHIKRNTEYTAKNAFGFFVKIIKTFY